MMFEFSFKYKDYELRACPQRLVRFDPNEPNETINLVKWDRRDDGQPYCYSLAYFRHDDEGYYLHFVGSRPFDHIEPDDVKIIWPALSDAQKILDSFHRLREELEDD